MAALVAISCLVVTVVPRVSRVLAPGDQPPLFALWAVGLTLSLCGSGLVLLSLRGSARPGATAVCFAVAYNVLIVVASFTLSPEALYEGDAAQPIDSSFAQLLPDSVFGILLAYLAVFLALAAYARRRLRAKLTAPVPAPAPASGASRVLAFGAVALMAGAIFASGAMPLLGLLVFFDYSTLVLATPMGLAVAGALLGAVVFAGQAFARAADRAALVRDASVLSIVLWSGALLVLLYHVLWFVCVMLLISLWPLKTVTSK